MENNLQKQEELIQLIVSACNVDEILSLGRCINIDKSEFYAETYTLRRLADEFVTRAFQKGKSDELIEEINKRKISLVSRHSVSDKSAEIFRKLLNHFLETFDSIDEKEFDESELFDPMEFEEKMRVRAKLNEDIVETGIRIKSDISVLRRKAYALDYKKYEKLIRKLARYYIHTICVMYPCNEFDSNCRFSYLYKSLISMIPDELYESDFDIEDKVEGIIYDTISKCLIFNE